MSSEIPDPIVAGRDPEAARVICRFEGKRLDNAVAASAREGWVDVYAKDEAGKLALSADRENFVVERLHGVVELEWMTLST